MDVIEKGLPPLQSPEEKAAAEKAASEEKPGKESASSSSKSANQGLSFSSSSKPGAAGAKSNKRKAVGQLDELKAELKSKEKAPKTSSKKAKKQSKTLLSFGDDTWKLRGCRMMPLLKREAIEVGSTTVGMSYRQATSPSKRLHTQAIRTTTTEGTSTFLLVPWA